MNIKLNGLPGLTFQKTQPSFTQVLQDTKNGSSVMPSVQKSRRTTQSTNLETTLSRTQETSGNTQNGRKDDAPSLELPDIRNPGNIADEERNEKILEMAAEALNLDEITAPKKGEVEAYISKAKIDYEVQRRFGADDPREPLWHAIASGNTAKVAELLGYDKTGKKVNPPPFKAKDLNSEDSQGNATFLSALAIGADVKIMKLLHDSGVDLSKTTDGVTNALHLAVKENNGEVVAYLLVANQAKKIKLNVNDVNTYGDTALTLALKNQSEAMVEGLLKFPYKTKEDALNPYLGSPPPLLLSMILKNGGGPVLGRGVQEELSGGDEEFAEWLEKTRGVKPDDVGYDELIEDEDVQKEFNKYVADKKTTPSWGTYYREKYNAGIIDIVADATTNWTASDISARNIFHYSVMANVDLDFNIKGKQLPNVNQRDSDGFTPLAYAAVDSDDDSIEKFLKLGADAAMMTYGRRSTIDLYVSTKLKAAFETFSKDDNGEENMESEGSAESKENSETDSTTKPKTLDDLEPNTFNFLNRGGWMLLDTKKFNVNIDKIVDIDGQNRTLIELAVKYKDIATFDKLVKEYGADPTTTQLQIIDDLRKVKPKTEDTEAEET